MRLLHFITQQFSNTKGILVALVCTLAGSFFVTDSYSQNYPTGPTALSPGVQPVYKINKRTRKVKRVNARVKNSAEYAFYDRVEKAAREKKKLLRKLAKPQYTNPLYFGHRSVPKRRAVHKMKYCEECGIRH